MKKNNMYDDSIMQWNPFKGCLNGCLYCKRSFQAMERFRKDTCPACFRFEPHEHEERLSVRFPKTVGDQFIFTCASGDISFCDDDFLKKILDVIKNNSDKTFLIQTKSPYWFQLHEFPENVILGITLESNRNYPDISDAPLQSARIEWFSDNILKHPRKSVTIEPILDFDPFKLLYALVEINPERIYIGYDTKKCGLPQPSIKKTLDFVELLKEQGNWKIKKKLIPERL